MFLFVVFVVVAIFFPYSLINCRVQRYGNIVIMTIAWLHGWRVSLVELAMMSECFNGKVLKIFRGWVLHFRVFFHIFCGHKNGIQACGATQAETHHQTHSQRIAWHHKQHIPQKYDTTGAARTIANLLLLMDYFGMLLLVLAIFFEFAVALCCIRRSVFVVAVIPEQLLQCIVLLVFLISSSIKLNFMEWFMSAPKQAVALECKSCYSQWPEGSIALYLFLKFLFYLPSNHC